MDRSHGEERVEGLCRKNTGHYLRSVSSRELSVVKEHATTSSIAMTENTHAHARAHARTHAHTHTHTHIHTHTCCQFFFSSNG